MVLCHPVSDAGASCASNGCYRLRSAAEVNEQDDNQYGAERDRRSALAEFVPADVSQDRYLPLTNGDNGQTNGGSSLFFVIHPRNIAAANAVYLATLHEMAPSSPEIPPTVFIQLFRDSVAKERLLSILSGFFALLGLLLSGIGIYGWWPGT